MRNQLRISKHCLLAICVASLVVLDRVDASVGSVPAAVRAVLIHTIEGRRFLFDLNEKTYGEIQLAVINNRAMPGGQFEMVERGRFRIVVNGHQSAKEIAATLVHEFQHIRDFAIVDRNIRGQNIGQLLYSAKSEILKAGSATVGRNLYASRYFYGGYILCLERRAYALTRSFEKDGFKVGESEDDELRYVQNRQLEPLKIRFGESDLRTLKRDCAKAKTLADYMVTLIDRSGVNIPEESPYKRGR